jgi:hypothetical protein
MTPTNKNRAASAALLMFSALLAGCTQLGPQSITRDRFDYSSAVADSWKQQALLNIVKLRYADSLVFVEVSQIVSGYTLQTTVSGGISHNVGPLGPFGPDSQTLGIQGQFTDRPTITYTPLTGPQYQRAVLTPIAPSSLLFLIQAGYAADFVLLMTVESINGLNNRSAAPARMNSGDPDFFQAVELIRKVQRSGNISMRIEVDKSKKEVTVLTFHQGSMTRELQAESAELRRLLKLDPDANEYQVSYGMAAGGGSDIDMATRSLAQVMLELAGTVDIPEAHLDERSAYPVPPPTETAQPLMHVRSGAARPKDPFAAVQYRGYWFWIGQNDLLSKRSFTYLTALFNFANTGKPENLPLVTIQAQ